MTWPTEAQCPKFYGKMGENQTQIVLPYPMVLDWAPTTRITKLTCHEKVADAMLRVFTKLKGEYGEEKLHELGIDQFGGCLNVRLKRGSKSAWSIHSWGCAVDLDADRNMLKETKRTARFARPEYLPMWKIIEGEGAVSYGRARDFDWMHWQFARP
jgi:hypothetical protein